MITWLALALVLASEALLLGALVVSLIRPDLRVWPPPGKNSWQFHVTFWPVITGVLGAIVLAWRDWNTFVWKADERILVGGALIAVGLGIADWGVRALGRIASSGLGGELRAVGPYRFSRNPQYVGDILAAIGFAVVANSTLLWIVTAPALAGLVLAPYAEEPWLRARFGTGYEAYSAQVPRFIGRSMRKLLKAVGWLFFAVLVVILLGLVFVWVGFPKTQDPPDVTVAATPERLARGEYLYRSVVVCDYCHGGVEGESAFNWVVPGTEGQGGQVFDLGGAGTIYARNITPTALESWTDGQLIRALRDGVNAKGSALFPIMPYHQYRNLAEQDVYAVVAYVRQLVPKPDQVPPRALKLPLSLIVRFMPSPAAWPPETTAPPDTSDTVATGRYLANVICAGCHMATDSRGNLLPGREWSGGHGFPERGWIANPANITPDSATGIGRWSRDDFVRRFRSMETTTAPAPAAADVPRTSMPWLQFATMRESDLGAIYDYLRTVPPVEHRVEKYERIPAPGGE